MSASFLEELQRVATGNTLNASYCVINEPILVQMSFWALVVTGCCYVYLGHLLLTFSNYADLKNFSWISVTLALLAAFIFACGLVHLLEAAGMATLGLSKYIVYSRVLMASVSFAACLLIINYRNDIKQQFVKR